MQHDPILKSFLAPTALSRRLEDTYGLENVRCQLITATLRDVYLVVSRVGRHILIVYPHDQRTLEDIEAEWEFVRYLAQQRMPVAPAIPTLQGEPLLTLHAPEGLRPAVLTPYLAGQSLRQRPSADASRQYGRLIATLHHLADTAPERFLLRAPEIATRLDQAREAIQSALLGRPTEVAYLAACGQELQARLLALPRSPLAYGIIHGDVIRTNALVTEDGRVSVIDFDWSGPGWRAYDIASYWLTLRGEPHEQPLAQAFLTGYSTVRTLEAQDYALLPLFEAIRALLEIGVPAQQVNQWGSAYLDRFFDQSLDRLKWSMQRLS